MSSYTGDGRVAVVTGASGGVGRATAIALAEEGFAVGLVARGRAGLEGARRDVEDRGVRACVAVADVADPVAVEAAAARLEEALGPVDVWVNNAMSTVFARFLDTEPAEFQRSTDVTYLGVVNGTRAALRRMAPRNRGTIVQVGSALAYRGIPLQSPYCGAKHAIQGFTESLRCELLHDGIDVHLTMVQLPAMNTPQFSWGRGRLPNHPQPVPPIFQPEVGAEAIVFAATAGRRELLVGWPTVVTVAGNKVAPGLGDRYLARNGVDAQQTGDPVDPRRPDNLFAPVDEERDVGARGIFSDVARDRSLQLAASRHRQLVAAGVAAAAAGAALVRRASHSRRAG